MLVEPSMRKVAPSAVAVAAFAAPAAAGADDFALRVEPEGLSALEAAARAIVPEVVELDDLETEVLGCDVRLEDGEVELDIRDASLRARHGGLYAELVLGVGGSGEVDGCFDAVSCHVSACAKSVEATLEVEIDASGPWVEVTHAEAELSLDSDQLDIEVDQCSAGDFLSAVRGVVGDWIVGAATPVAERLLSGRVADVVGDFGAGAIPQRVELGEMELELALSHFDLDPNRGVSAAGAAAVSAIGAPPREPSAGAAAGDPLPDAFGPGAFQIAVSDRTINQALREAQDAGLFEIDLAEIAPDLDASAAGFADQLGLPAGADIGLEIELGQAPEAAFAREGAGVWIDMGELEARVTVDEPGVTEREVRVAVGASARVTAETTERGAFVLEPAELDLRGLAVHSGDSAIAADPARLEAFLSDAARPMLADALAELPIAPAVEPAEGVYVWLRAIEADSGWLRAAFDLAVADPDDNTLPSTELVDPPAVIGAGTTEIEATGRDSRTPTPLLRYRAWLDGEPLNSEPEFGGVIPVSAPAGEYTLEVAAVDLAGNIDTEPAFHRLSVDTEPPELEILEAPEYTSDGEIEASWRARDASGGVRTEWELLALSADRAAGEVVREGEAGERGDIRIAEPGAHAHYVLRVAAIDDAGNITSEELGFGTVRGGCNAAGGGGAGAAAAALAALLFLSLGGRAGGGRARRRGRAVAVIAVVAIPALALPALTPRALGQGVGNHFSSPTDGDGAAAFWNPAALARTDGSGVYAASGLSLIRIRYDADSGGTSRTFVPKPEPTLGGHTDELGDDLWLGFTIGAPHIDGASWERDDGAGHITRYYAVDARYYHATATPAVAYRARPWLSVGAGIRFVRSEMVAQIDQDIGAEVNMALGSSDPDAPLPYAEPALAAPTDLSAAGWGVGLVAGVLLEPQPPLRVGLGVHSPSTSSARGDVAVDYSDEMRAFVDDAEPDVELPELSGEVEADLNMPLMIFSSVAWEPAAEWEVMADYRFLRRSSAANTDILVTESTSDLVGDTAVVRGNDDKHGVGLRLSRLFDEVGITAALRLRYESNSVPRETTSPSNLDFAQYEVGGAAAWAVTDGVELMGQYSRFFLDGRDVDESLNRPLAEPALAAFNKPSPTGEYSGVSDYIALGAAAAW